MTTHAHELRSKKTTHTRSKSTRLLCALKLICRKSPHTHTRAQAASSETVSVEQLGAVEKRNVFFKDPLVVLSHWEIRMD